MKCCCLKGKANEQTNSASESKEEKFTPLRDMSTRKSSSPEFEMRLLHRLEGHGGAVRYCTVDPGGKILATCSTDGKINLWSIATGENIRTLKDGHSAEVTACSFCSFGSILASSSRDKKVILWNYQTGKRASRLELHSDAVLFCAFSKDGKFLASASRDKTARLYKIRSEVGEFVPGAEVKQLSGHTSAVNVVKFSLDGAIALTGSDDRTIRAWRKENDWACVCTLTDFYGPVKRIIFSPVKDPVFVTLAGYRATLWTMHGNNFTPNCSVDVRGSDKQIKDITFIPDGRYVVGVAVDGTVNIWDSAVEEKGACTTWKCLSHNLSQAGMKEGGRANKNEGAIEQTCCIFARRHFISADSSGLTHIWEIV